MLGSARKDCHFWLFLSERAEARLAGGGFAQCNTQME